MWAELAATDFLMNDRAASAAAFAHAARVDSSYVRNRPNLMSMWRWVAPSAAR